MLVTSSAVHIYDLLKINCIGCHIHTRNASFGCQHTLFLQNVLCKRKLDSNQIYVYKYQDIYIFVLAFAMFSDRNFEGASDIQFCHVFSQHHDIFNRYVVYV